MRRTISASVRIDRLAIPGDRPDRLQHRLRAVAVGSPARALAAQDRALLPAVRPAPQVVDIGRAHDIHLRARRRWLPGPDAANLQLPVPASRYREPLRASRGAGGSPAAERDCCARQRRGRRDLASRQSLSGGRAVLADRRSHGSRRALRLGHDLGRIHLGRAGGEDVPARIHHLLCGER